MIDLDNHPEWQSLLGYIIAHPDEDLARLVAADWLEERESQDVRCRGCPDRPGRNHRPYPGGWDECERCEGSGYVSNGLARRAEFVRLQVEIASVFPPPDCESQSAKRHRHDLMDREQVLLTFDNELLRFGGAVITDRPCLIDAATIAAGSNTILLYQRGFVSEARCPMYWWLAPEHGPRIARANPIRKVVVTDRRPAVGQSLRGTATHIWNRVEGHSLYRSEIRSEVWEFLKGGAFGSAEGRNGFQLRRYYDTQQDALDDLSDALIAWARATK